MFIFNICLDTTAMDYLTNFWMLIEQISYVSWVFSIIQIET